jgi:hypothetical protein
MKPVPGFKPTMCFTSSVKQLFASDGAETHRFVVPCNATASTPVIEAVGVETLDLLFASAVAVETPDLLAGTKHGRHICQNQLTPAFPKSYCLCVALITWG